MVIQSLHVSVLPGTGLAYYGDEIAWGKFSENTPQPNYLPRNGELLRQNHKHSSHLHPLRVSSNLPLKSFPVLEQQASAGLLGLASAIPLDTQSHPDSPWKRLTPCWKCFSTTLDNMCFTRFLCRQPRL